ERKIALSNDGVFIYVDGKLPPVRSLTWENLLLRIAKEISYKLHLANQQESETPADAFMNVVAEAVAAKKVALVFDEIEYLSPFSSMDDHWRKDFIPFWQTIWACQSRHSNLSVIVAGVNPTVVENDRFQEVQNPLFGIVPPQYLRGLRKEEVQRMVRTLGKPMGLRMSAEAVDYLFLRYGGHPLLTRIACSLMHKEIARTKPDLPFDVKRSHLLDKEDSRDNELSFYCRHIVSELSQFYPDEYGLLEKIATGQLADYVDFLKEPTFSSHLTNYGLIDKDGSGRPIISIPAVAKYLGLEAARREGRKTILKVVELLARDHWLKERVVAINSNLDSLQRAIKSNGLPPLFGAISYPESHKFFELLVCANENDFAVFINVLNRCFVESIEAYGQSV